jgi:hypothetical protein
VSDGIKPTRIEDTGFPLPDEVSIDGAYTGDDVDWDAAPGVDGQDQWKQPVRCATTASVTIATALNAADVIDGVTLVAGDRVLVKNQGTASQNGIYVVGTTPARAADMDDDLEVLGAVVYVIAGTANAGTVWTVTNTAATVVDTDAINWAALSGWSLTVSDEGTPLATAATTLDFVGAGVTASGTGATKTITISGGGSGDSSGQIVAIFDGGGAAPAAGAVVDVPAPYSGTLTSWEMLGDVSGSAEVKVGKDVAANFPPTFPADLITAAAPPTLTAAARAASSTLTGWTTAITAGDILRFSLVSASTLGRVTCVLHYSRP